MAVYAGIGVKRPAFPTGKCFLTCCAHTYLELLQYAKINSPLQLKLFPGHPVPLLLLQPLVENCIYHGIKEKEGCCGIKLSVFMHPDGLNIRITDNGMGIKPHDLEKIRHNLNHPEIENKGHIGLYNANKRLALIYGKKYSIRILSRFKRGTSIHLFLPYSAET